MPEWQRIREDEWAFGEKVRGLVRRRLAEVYFDEERNPSWIWFAFIRQTFEGGSENTLQDAVAAAETCLGIEQC